MELTVQIDKFSKRPNHNPGPGGALNAGYTPVDALAKVSNMLGQLGLDYGKDFNWRSFEYSTQAPMNQPSLVLTFDNHDVMLSAKLAIESSK